jgi:hypothetical protein
MSVSGAHTITNGSVHIFNGGSLFVLAGGSTPTAEANVVRTFDEINSMELFWDANDQSKILGDDGSPVTSDSQPVTTWWSNLRPMKIVPIDGATLTTTVDVNGRRFVRDTPVGGMAISVVNPDTGLVGLKIADRSLFCVVSTTDVQSSAVFIHKGLNSPTSNYPLVGNFNFTTNIGRVDLRVNVNGTVRTVTVMGASMVPGQQYTVGMQIWQDGNDVVIWARAGNSATPVVNRVTANTFVESIHDIRFGKHTSSSFRSNVYRVEFSSRLLTMNEFNTRYETLKAQYATL